MIDDHAASRGLPSLVWREGQTRRFEMIARAAALRDARALDIGCGVGAYASRMRDAGAEVAGTEVEWPRARDARADGLAVTVAPAEALPFGDAAFDTVLLHEVLEHVRDDRAAVAEVARVLKPGGRALIFVPNRLWPFETHGAYWRGQYRFGNAPLVNYLPDPLRNRLAPHVRVYTSGALLALLDGLPMVVVLHTQVYPGYDKLAARRPRAGGWLRWVSYALERTPARRFGLSHFLVAERTAPRGYSGMTDLTNEPVD